MKEREREREREKEGGEYIPNPRQWSYSGEMCTFFRQWEGERESEREREREREKELKTEQSVKTNIWARNKRERKMDFIMGSSYPTYTRYKWLYR